MNRNEQLARRVIDCFYPAGELRDLLWTHSRAVADKVLNCLKKRNMAGIDPGTAELAALLHDIGIIRTDAPSIHCHGTLPYLAHGMAGAAMLRPLGLYLCADVCERHTGSGLTAKEIRDQHLPLPARDLTPRTAVERLVCYADKFFSKTPGRLTEEKPLEKIRAQMERFGTASLDRFDALHREFG